MGNTSISSEITINKKEREKSWNDKKTLLNDSKKFLKNRPVLVS
jgi:hypothetical protein